MPLTSGTTLTEIKRSMDTDVAHFAACTKNGVPAAMKPYLSMTGGGAFSTMKPTEEGDGVIVRVVGLDEKTETTIEFAKPIREAFLCDLKEDEISALEVRDGKVSFPVDPWRIVTVKARF